MVKPKPILLTPTESTKSDREEFAGLEARAFGRGVNLGE
jgi:hypothetical protein